MKVASSHAIPLRFAWVVAFSLAASACQPDIAMSEASVFRPAPMADHPATTEWGQDAAPMAADLMEPAHVFGTSEGE